MFAIVVPGQPVIAAQQVSQERFLCVIPSSLSLINHVAVFMTGTPFPDGFGCTVHLELPGKGWQIIGGLSNAKPSAIFKLRGSAITSGAAGFQTYSPTPTALDPSLPVVNLGIFCEPLQSVEAQLALLGNKAVDTTATSNEIVLRNNVMTDPIDLSTKIVKHLFYAVASYAQSPLPDGTPGNWIDLRAIEAWYDKFVNKVKNTGVAFLSQDD